MAVNQAGLLLDDDHDLSVSSYGQIELVRGAELVRQRIVCALKLVKGEWFADSGAGVDYKNILVRQPNMAYVEAEFKLAISSVPGVVSIRQFKLTKDEMSDEMEVEFEVMTDEGITVEGST